MTLESHLEGSTLDIPDTRGFIDGRGHDAPAVGTPGHPENLANVTLEPRYLLTGFRIPKPRRFVLRRRDDTRPIRAELRVKNGVFVALKRDQQFACFGSPY